MNNRQKHIQYIDSDIKRVFPYDTMMQKLHQIRRELTRNQSLEKVLRFIDRSTKSVPKTA